jgi:hypothetical protein
MDDRREIEARERTKKTFPRGWSDVQSVVPRMRKRKLWLKD